MGGGSRRWGLALLAAACVGGHAVGAAGAPSAEVVAVPDLFSSFAAGADGLMWGVQGAAGTNDAVVRFDAGRLVTSAPLPAGLQPFGSNGILHVLPDGSTGLFARRVTYDAGSPRTASFALVRISSASGQVTSVADLPQLPVHAAGMTVGPDGAVWFARSCQDEVDRLAADGTVSRRVRLPRLGCGTHADGRELGAGLAFDGRGALWLVNLCQGRIDRISLAGRVREWRTLRISCPYGDIFLPEATPATIAPDPRGGISYASRAMGGGSGRVRDGRRERYPSYGAGAFAGDGVLWRPLPSGVERRDPDGTVATYAAPRGQTELSGVAVTSTGAAARVRGSYWKTYYGDSHNPDVPVYLDPRVELVAADGSLTSVPLPDGGTDVPAQLNGADLFAAPDGALWVFERRTGPDYFYAGDSRVVRALPDALPAPRPATVAVEATLERVGRTAWLHLTCGADVARFCTGTATLAGAGTAVRPAPFAIPGQGAGAVPLRLGRRALRDLRRRGRVRVTAAVRLASGPRIRRPLWLR